MWKRTFSISDLNKLSENTLIQHIGIEFTAIKPNALEARMPVDSRTCQPFGLLHGGASAVLAETLASTAGYLCTKGDEIVLGLELNVSHIKSVKQGWVTGCCTPIHIGRKHHNWQVMIYDEQESLCAVCRLTVYIKG